MDKRRVYCVESYGTASAKSPPTPGMETRVKSFVLAASPGAAALAIIGESNIEVVSQKDKYQAALAALMADSKK